MDEETKKKLIADHFFFKEVNEEDHLRIISMKNGGNVGDVLGRCYDDVMMIYDVTNRQRLGLTEYQGVRQMYDGIKKLIELEKAAALTERISKNSGEIKKNEFHLNMCEEVIDKMTEIVRNNAQILKKFNERKPIANFYI
ncbi:unnamed protein product [Caenorhabditis angaria]|uniref:arginine kinase n=1 Tax=Caenorhabditis angaria TaxID=860376 RepID=A0A9P1IGR6_9PELO|nr:unnamed protein product [Caenorhabditis angaria]